MTLLSSLGPGRTRAMMLGAAMLALATAASSMTVIPIRDGELYRRSDVVVHGVVVSSDAVASESGRPETVTVIQPLRVLKGQLSGFLVLHQAGGVLSGGVAFHLFGRPVYAVGEEVVVFAIARDEGDFQTAEMLLGKFAVEQDDSGRLFAVPALADARGAVRVLEHGFEAPQIERTLPSEEGPGGASRFPERPGRLSEDPDSLGPPRELSRFLDFLGNGAEGPVAGSAVPEGRLQRVFHAEPRQGLVPEWANVGDEPGGQLQRWFNSATAQFYLDGTTNMTGGGVTQATNALATWTNDPNSTINYTKTTDTTKFPIHMAAASAPCGWSTCFGPTDSGVVGCGGSPSDVPPMPCPADHLYRGDCYGQIQDLRSFGFGSPEVWLRCWTEANVLSSATTQAVLTHEAGHTLGLDHPDQFSSPHDVCKGDESTAIMNSTTEGSTPTTTLGTDDQDAIRWLYGDGQNHCGGSNPAPTVTSINPTSGPASGGTSVTITGTGFLAGATVKIGGVAATAVNVGATSITCKSPALPAGTLNDVVVTNTDAKAGTLTKGWFSDFSDVPQAYLYHAAIEKIVRAGITSGCATGKYCPNDPVTRDAMAKFLLVAKHGSGFSPPAATGTVFCDVSVSTLLAKWIEEVKTEGIASGAEIGACGKPNYHPTDVVTRDAMAKFLELALHGSSFSPPAATGTVFCDVGASTFLAKWMEQLKADGITSGCSGGACGKPDYCPGGTVSRGEMAKFLRVAFGL